MNAARSHSSPCPSRCSARPTNSVKRLRRTACRRTARAPTRRGSIAPSKQVAVPLRTGCLTDKGRTIWPATVALDSFLPSRIVTMCPIGRRPLTPILSMRGSDDARDPPYPSRHKAAPLLRPSSTSPTPASQNPTTQKRLTGRTLDSHAGCPREARDGSATLATSAMTQANNANAKTSDTVTCGAPKRMARSDAAICSAKKIAVSGSKKSLGRSKRIRRAVTAQPRADCGKTNRDRQSVAV